MTIRLEHLTIRPTTDSWLRDPQDGVSLLRTHLYDTVLLSIVRHIMRERGDCRIVPVVIEATAHATNVWGHNIQVEVQYTNQYRAIYGAHYSPDTRVTNVQCYMD